MDQTQIPLRQSIKLQPLPLPQQPSIHSDKESVNTQEFRNIPEIQNHLESQPYNHSKQVSLQKDDAKKQNEPIFLCEQHLKEILFVCERVDCQNKRILCSQCILENISHFTSHQPMKPAETALAHLSTSPKPSDRDIEVQIKNQFESLILKFSQDYVQMRKNLVQEYNSQVCRNRDVNQDQAVCLSNNFASLSHNQNENSTGNFSCDLNSLTIPEMQSFVQRHIQGILQQNKNDQLKQHYLERVQNYFTISNFAQSVDFLQLMVDIREQMDNSQTLKHLNSFPSCKIKIKSFPAFKNLTSEQIMFNTKLYMDLSKFTPVEIKECLTNVYFLQVIDLSIRFHGKIQNITLLLNKKCKHLSLNFSECNIQVQGLNQLDNSFVISSIGDKVTLESLYIDFSMNGMKDMHSQILCKILEKVKSINDLNLNFRLNCIGLYGITKLSQGLQKLPNLLSLNLNFDGFGALKNVLGTEALEFLCKVISQMSNLRKLSLGLADTEINSAGSQMIRSMIESLPQLVHVDLSVASNQVSGSSILSIVESLGKLLHLKILSLNMDHVNIQEEYISQLIKAIENLSHLSEISLSARNTNISFSALNIEFDRKDNLKKSKFSKMIDLWREEAKNS